MIRCVRFLFVLRYILEVLRLGCVGTLFSQASFTHTLSDIDKTLYLRLRELRISIGGYSFGAPYCAHGMPHQEAVLGDWSHMLMQSRGVSSSFS